MMLQKLRNAPLPLHSASLRTKAVQQKNKQAPSASGPSARETRIKFRLERGDGPVWAEANHEAAAAREKEAPTEEEERQEAREKKEGQQPRGSRGCGGETEGTNKQMKMRETDSWQ